MQYHYISHAEVYNHLKAEYMFIICSWNVMISLQVPHYTKIYKCNFLNVNINLKRRRKHQRRKSGIKQILIKHIDRFFLLQIYFKFWLHCPIEKSVIFLVRHALDQFIVYALSEYFQSFSFKFRLSYIIPIFCTISKPTNSYENVYDISINKFMQNNYFIFHIGCSINEFPFLFQSAPNIDIYQWWASFIVRMKFFRHYRTKE
jgi:hypothetical protein